MGYLSYLFRPVAEVQVNNMLSHVEIHVIQKNLNSEDKPSPLFTAALAASHIVTVCCYTFHLLKICINESKKY